MGPPFPPPLKSGETTFQHIKGSNDASIIVKKKELNVERKHGKKERQWKRTGMGGYDDGGRFFFCPSQGTRREWIDEGGKGGGAPSSSEKKSKGGRGGRRQGEATKVMTTTAPLSSMTEEWQMKETVDAGRIDENGAHVSVNPKAVVGSTDDASDNNGKDNDADNDDYCCSSGLDEDDDNEDHYDNEDNYDNEDDEEVEIRSSPK